ncbi:MAG: phytanoyl-CoA dioxygenase family protein [Thermoanaerobaculia bacterium]|nr:phytanoyl-CoA dioxygenase family protein [Thermoanaerobaculia bacterium]
MSASRVQGASTAQCAPLPAGLVEEFQENGFALVPGVVTRELIVGLRAEAERLLIESDERGGARNALANSTLFRGLAASGPIAEVARQVLGADAIATKLTIFDKSPLANWKVPWHQDLTIRVRERFDVPGFGPWSIKDGEPHVQPPVSLLERILAVRLHLDDTPADNGALRVIPGSHRLGRVTAEEIAALRRERSEVLCPVGAGGAMLMSPLLLHASSVAAKPSRRRVAHYECCATSLPGPLAWS